MNPQALRVTGAVTLTRDGRSVGTLHAGGGRLQLALDDPRALRDGVPRPGLRAAWRRLRPALRRADLEVAVSVRGLHVAECPPHGSRHRGRAWLGRRLGLPGLAPRPTALLRSLWRGRHAT